MVLVLANLACIHATCFEAADGMRLHKSITIANHITPEAASSASLHFFYWMFVLLYAVSMYVP